jgi:hypothetical protein
VAVLALALGGAPAAAHVAVSEDANNRYLKLTPMADRVRLAYTILIGEQPGRLARQALDRDRDRTISAEEADRWAADLAGRIQRQLTVEIDGEPVEVAWSDVVAGFDDRAVTAGTFSLDLIAWLCTPTAGARHQVRLVDRSTLDSAGETELRIADDVGVQLEGDLAGRRELTLKGSTPLADGLDLVYTVARTTALDDGRCAPAPKAPPATSRWPWLLGLAVIVLIVAQLIRRFVSRPRS